MNGQVIMYAEHETDSMKKAIGETNRRRKIQTEFNYKNKIIPQTVKKGVRDVLEATVAAEVKAEYRVDSSKMPKKGAQGAHRQTGKKRCVQLQRSLLSNGRQKYAILLLN